MSTAIASDLALALDPALIFENLDMTPDAWQLRFLRSTEKRTLLNCSRQSGKSIAVAVLATHQALYHPGSLILLLSPGLRQSMELFKRCIGAYQAVGQLEKPDAETKLTLELNNGSRIISLPGTEATIRGYSGVDLLIIDEASRVPNDLYAAVRPMLAVSKGRLVALSTPYGTRGWWYEAWAGHDPWDHVRVPATECPRISAEFLAEESRSMGDWHYQQEYNCEFMDGQTQAFRREDIDAAFTERIETWTL